MIYVIGSSNTDMVVQCAHLPKPGETVLGGGFISVHGGKGANQAVAAARMGGETTFVCKVGDDNFGTASIQAYQNEGIDTSFIQTVRGSASGIALIVVDESGENYIAVAPGANALLTPEDVQPAIDKLNKGDILLLQLEIPLKTVEYAAREAHQKGVTVILDPAPAPKEGLPDSIFQYLSAILPNETEAAMVSGISADEEAMANALFDKGVRNVIITLGNQGCLLKNQDGIRRFEAQPVQAVDSTAAGDAFAGAFAVALSEGLNVPSALKTAQKAAVISVTRKGAQPSLPYRNELS